MAEKIYPGVEEAVAGHDLELARMKDALALLGVSACSWCHKYYKRTEPGNLFDAGGGELICYGSIREWWPQRYLQLSIKERDDLEGKLVFWLRDYHHAESFKDASRVPPSEQQELCLIANCLECKGTGKLGGEERCRYCEGRGTLWVVVAKKKV